MFDDSTHQLHSPLGAPISSFSAPFYAAVFHESGAKLLDHPNTLKSSQFEQFGLSDLTQQVCTSLPENRTCAPISAPKGFYGAQHFFEPIKIDKKWPLLVGGMNQQIFFKKSIQFARGRAYEKPTREAYANMKFPFLMLIGLVQITRKERMYT